jgi:bacillithiol biosynthesis cysteine-adding enzyme BshC
VSDTRDAHVEGLELQVAPLSSPKLVEDYYAGAQQLAPFYSGHAWSARAYQRRAQTIQSLFSRERGDLLRSAVHPTSGNAAAKLDRIAVGEGYVVTTGQQPGLFGGPLYTAYKILTAVRLAQKLEQLLDAPVAPLFWVPADDHDWDEVNHVSVIDAKNQLVRLSAASTTDTPVSMAQRRFGDDISAVIDQLAAVLPQNDFAAENLALLRDSYTPHATVAEAFQAFIARTFSSFDLLVTYSADPALKRFAVPLFRSELEHAEAHARLLRQQTDRLIAAGYHEQVAIALDAANLMYEDQSGRERLVREDGGWMLRRTKRYFDQAELLDRLETEPERFSANVLLRPVLESYAFPTLAYVGGPAEVSYFAQTGCLFSAHGVDMPLVFPRASIDLVEAKVRKVLDKFDLTPADFRRPFHELISQLARDELPEGVRTALLQLRRGITSGYEALVDASAGIDATLRGPLEGARNASHKQVEDAERKILSHLKKQQAISTEQLQKASSNLFPDGQRQERVFGIVNYLARYGSAMLSAIALALDLQIDRDVPGWDGVRCV